jgi:hypothetical protein
MGTTDEIREEAKDQYKDSTMSKAGRLAMELNTEKKRLKEEMEQLQNQVDDMTPVTPTGTIDSYVKWIATITGVSGVFLMSAGFGQEGQIAYLIAACSWIFVGSVWNDKAIMIGSAVSGTAVLMNLVELLI